MSNQSWTGSSERAFCFHGHVTTSWSVTGVPQSGGMPIFQREGLNNMDETIRCKGHADNNKPCSCGCSLVICDEMLMIVGGDSRSFVMPDWLREAIEQAIEKQKRKGV